MRTYYIQKTTDSAFEGTYTEQQLQTMVSSGKIDKTWRAVEAGGQTSRQLKNTPDDQWTSLTDLFPTSDEIKAAFGTDSSVLAPPTEGTRISARAATRYRDAYLVARATAGTGGAVKAVGILLGCLVALGAVVAGSQGNSNVFILFGGILLAIIIAVPVYVLGVLVAAHGQVLNATLDEAVHTSPFLTDQQRATVMSLT